MQASLEEHRLPHRAEDEAVGEPELANEREDVRVVREIVVIEDLDLRRAAAERAREPAPGGGALEDGRPRAGCGEPAGGGEAAEAAPEDDRVEFEHRFLCRHCSVPTSGSPANRAAGWRNC